MKSSGLCCQFLKWLRFVRGQDGVEHFGSGHILPPKARFTTIMLQLFLLLLQFVRMLREIFITLKMYPSVYYDIPGDIYTILDRFVPPSRIWVFSYSGLHWFMYISNTNRSILFNERGRVYYDRLTNLWNSVGFYIELEFGNVDFLGRGEPYYLKKCFWSKEENQQKTKPT